MPDVFKIIWSDYAGLNTTGKKYCHDCMYLDKPTRQNGDWVCEHSNNRISNTSESWFGKYEKEEGEGFSGPWIYTPQEKNKTNTCEWWERRISNTTLPTTLSDNNLPDWSEIGEPLEAEPSDSDENVDNSGKPISWMFDDENEDNTWGNGNTTDPTYLD